MKAFRFIWTALAVLLMCHLSVPVLRLIVDPKCSVGMAVTILCILVVGALGIIHGWRHWFD